MHRRIATIVTLLCALPVFLIAGSVTGKVSDAKTGSPLAGANVMIEGTHLGAAADAQGKYNIPNVPDGSYTIAAKMIGYENYRQAVTVQGAIALNFKLMESKLQLSEVTVAGNFASDRETPVAFTTIGEKQIRNNFTVQDVPHLFANTPGVYITTDGGSGMGDSKVMIRGFDEQRIAVMINNVPVNDPESKKVYWSNWGSLPAASQAVQVQRGVGSSLYGSGALGGSINVVTKDAPADESIGVSSTIGQFGIFKMGIDYNSGLVMGNKSFIGRFNYLQGNGWRDDTFYRGIQYYLSAMVFPNEANTIKFILHGAPQYHAYSYYGFPAEDFALYGREWNGHPHVDEDQLPSDEEDRATKLMDVLFNKTEIGNSGEGGWVIGNGRASLDNNVYHKPQFEIHHSMKLDEVSKLTSTFFVSNGYGYGENLGSYYYVSRDENGLMTYDAIDNAGVYQYRAYSDHFQTGIMSSYDTKVMNHDITAGAELRYWKARHAGEILNTFSMDDISYYIGNNKQYFEQGELYYDYTTTKPQVTMFGHAMWHFGNLNVMTDVQYSTMTYNVVEDIPSSNNYPNNDDDEAEATHGGGSWSGTATYDHDGNPDTDEIPVVYTLWDYEKTFDFVSPKIGLNYNVNEQINVFANWSAAVNEPRVKYFFNYGGPNDDLDLEETSDLELGAGYVGELAGIPVNVKLNWYNIDFTGKALKITDPEKANQPGYDYKGRRYIPIGDSKYTGTELAANFILPYNLDLGVNLSAAANEWGNPEDSEGAQYLYSNADVEDGVHFIDQDDDDSWDTGELAVDGVDFADEFGNRVEVGMPQLIYGTTLNWNNGPFTVGLAYRHYEDIYILENNSEVCVEGHFDDTGAWVEDEISDTLPDANVVDAVARINAPVMGGLDISLHVKNIFDEEYWQKGDNYGFLPGAARTIEMNLGLTIK